MVVAKSRKSVVQGRSKHYKIWVSSWFTGRIMGDGSDLHKNPKPLPGDICATPPGAVAICNDSVSLVLEYSYCMNEKSVRVPRILRHD